MHPWCPVRRLNTLPWQPEWVAAGEEAEDEDEEKEDEEDEEEEEGVLEQVLLILQGVLWRQGRQRSVETSLHCYPGLPPPAPSGTGSDYTRLHQTRPHLGPDQARPDQTRLH